MSIRISLKLKQQEKLIERLHQAYAGNHLRLVKRIHTILYALEGRSVADIAEILGMSEQCVRNYIAAFVLKGLDSLAYQHPSGRPPRLTKTQKRELGRWIDKGPEAAGYDLGCWTSALIQDLILTRFGVEYSPQYIAELLKNMDYSWQKARFASDHLEDVSEEQHEWMTKKWPDILRVAKEQKAWLLFGDECSFAQWGSLSYTWARPPADGQDEWQATGLQGVGLHRVLFGSPVLPGADGQIELGRVSSFHPRRLEENQAAREHFAGWGTVSYEPSHARVLCRPCPSLDRASVAPLFPRVQPDRVFLAQSQEARDTFALLSHV